MATLTQLVTVANDSYTIAEALAAAGDVRMAEANFAVFNTTIGKICDSGLELWEAIELIG